MSLSRSIQTTSPPPHLTGHANALPVPATTYKLHKTHPFIKAQVEDMIQWCCCSMKPDNITASRNFYCSLVWDTRSNSTSTTSAKDTRARVNKALPKSKNYKRPGRQSVNSLMMSRGMDSTLRTHVLTQRYDRSTPSSSRDSGSNN